MESVKLIVRLSVLMLILFDIQEASLNSKSDNDTQINDKEIDFSNPEIVENIYKEIAQLKEEGRRAKEEAREAVQRVKEETKEEVQRVKEETKEEIQKVKDEANMQIKEAEAKNQRLEEVVNERNKQMDREMEKIKLMALDLVSMKPVLRDDVSRIVRNIDPLETFGAANYSLLEQLVRLMVPVSCYEWRQQGFDVTGYYLIDPDGRGVGEPPFNVFCDMIRGYTLVHHDSEGIQQPDSCYGEKCYKKTIGYTASDDQIHALLLRSDSCQQSIKIDCLQNPLKEDGKTLSTWTDRQGRENEYWTGDGDAYTCTCGLSRSCTDPRKPCNCDADVDGLKLTDKGDLSNMDSLPVKQLQFGSLAGKPLQMNYTLGPLRCFGSRPVSEPRSCRDLFISGQYLSGYYFLNINGAVDLVFCNMEDRYLSMNATVQPAMEPIEFRKIKEMKEELDRQKLGQTMLINRKSKEMKEELEEYKEKNVAFSAYTGGSSTYAGRIAFEYVTLNNGSGYNERNGVFTAPVAGPYFVSVHLIAYANDEYIKAYVRKDGSFLVGIYSYAYDNDRVQLGVSTIEYLRAGETLDVYMSEGKRAANYRGMRFNGFLLK